MALLISTWFLSQDEWNSVSSHDECTPQLITPKKLELTLKQNLVPIGWQDIQLRYHCNTPDMIRGPIVIFLTNSLQIIMHSF